VVVPRSSGTPVATWAWPTWVVSRRRELEAMFVLLESSSPSRNFYRLRFTPPLSLVRRIGPSYSDSSYDFDFGSDPVDPDSEITMTEEPL
jgi:hypothetical protein